MNNNKMTTGEWLPLIGMTFSAFVFNTSEFMPIGLLTDIATEFQITEAHAGMLISVYAWAVALLSLPLMLAVSRMEFKKLLLGVLSLFTICQVLSALSTGYLFLMFSRIGVACMHAIFWSIASPMAVRAVSERHRSLALSMIVTGTSIAMIFGLPLGRAIGLAIGWRMTFLCVAAVSFLTVVYLALVFPRMENRGKFSLRKMPELLKNRTLIVIYLLTLGISTAYYTGYSYIEPFLKQIAEMPDELITFTLTIFGAAGLLGSYTFSRYYDRAPFAYIGLATSSIAAALLLMQVASLSHFSMIALCGFWGMVVVAFNVVFQAEIIKCTPQDATAVSMSIFSGIFNLGIGCGTWIGGAVCTFASIRYIGYAGGLIGGAASFYCISHLLKLLRKE